MMNEATFERELEIFRREFEEAAQSFYAYLAIHAVAADHAEVHDFLNRTPLFWNTCAGALQTASIIVLGRIFDRNSPHNIAKLLLIARKHPEIFSRSALARRKQGKNSEPPEWLDEYLSGVYEPTVRDFDHLGILVRRRRKIYEAKYESLRHKWFAHKNLGEHSEAAPLFAKTNIRELQQLFGFLRSLYDALWELFFNGRKPRIRQSRFSLKRFREKNVAGGRSGSAPEEITREVDRLLKSVSGVRSKTQIRVRRK